MIIRSAGGGGFRAAPPWPSSLAVMKPEVPRNETRIPKHTTSHMATNNSEEYKRGRIKRGCSQKPDLRIGGKTGPRNMYR